MAEGDWCQGGLVLEGSGPRGCLLWAIPACNGAHPPVYRITDTCKNITLHPTSLRAVIKCLSCSISLCCCIFLSFGNRN